MGKASSSKKIKKVQQAGVSRSPGQRRNLAFPALIVAIVLVGSVLTFFARDHRQGQEAEAPVANQDHWHAAFGIDVCGVFEKNLADAKPDYNGIHTHSDGLIHIHPYVASVAGKNATFGAFADQVGITLGDGEFTLPSGKTYKNGDKCSGEDGRESKGRVAMYVWPPQAIDTTKPTIVTDNLADVRFKQDGQAFVLAFAPEGTEPELPPSLPELANPSDLEAPPDPGSTDYTTVPGETTPGVPDVSVTPTTEASATTAVPGG